jgi:hypothetical protein
MKQNTLLRWLHPKRPNIAIDHNNKYIYIHVPKTAGSSIRKALQTAPWPHVSQGTRYRIPKHATALQVKEIVGDRNWQSHFTFAFVRNPWDLMVSSYHWWLRKGNRYESTRNMAKLVEQCGSFDSFIKSELGSHYVNEFKSPGLKEWYCDEHNMILLDFIGRFENIADDFQHIGKCLKVKVPDLPYMNISDRSPYRKYYNDETYQAVANRFAWTIEHFGYEF